MKTMSIEETNNLLLEIRDLSLEERSIVLTRLIGSYSGKTDHDFMFTLKQSKELMELDKK